MTDPVSGGPDEPVCRDPGPDLWKFDMHIHSAYSGDSSNEPSAIVESYRRTGILPLVCDHNRTAGSEAVYHDLRKICPDIPVILAEEIMTQQGEVIGVFLTEMIPPHLDIEETLDIIRDQGALAIASHPFCSYRGSRVWENNNGGPIASVDIIEGFNAHVIYRKDNDTARRVAGELHKPFSVGSDAHSQKELGRIWLELEPFDSPKGLLKSLTAKTVRYPVLERQNAPDDRAGTK